MAVFIDLIRDQVILTLFSIRSTTPKKSPPRFSSSTSRAIARSPESSGSNWRRENRRHTQAESVPTPLVLAPSSASITLYVSADRHVIGPDAESLVAD
ncbi:hypothetical protein [Cryobacterium sp. CAN_C2]|uniref:hypothetical protein n=1 Tax=Cryobacterium sp. CAN_C2 TaxID=2787723 RepID=UPI002FF02766